MPCSREPVLSRYSVGTARICGKLENKPVVSCKVLVVLEIFVLIKELFASIIESSLSN